MTIALGVNAGTNTWHDASACLVDDTGRVLAFIEQERLTRLRHAPKDHAPAEAVAAVLTAAGITAEEVDAIAVGWDEPRARAHIGDVWRFDSPAEFLRDLGLAGGRVSDLQFVPHHRAHAASAFYASPYPAAAVLVVDGNGEDESVSLYAARRGHPMVRQAAWPQTCSLGHCYEAVSRWLGLGKHGAGKVMGLAAYSHTQPVPDPCWLTVVDGDVISVLGTDSRLGYDDLITRWADLITDYTGAAHATASPPRLADDLVAVRLAAAAQTTVENVLTALVAHARSVTGHQEVCLAGGVALNCAANGRLTGPVYVPPMPHDAGVALGAAWSVLPPTESAVFQPYTGGVPGPLSDDLSDLRVQDADVDAVVRLLLDGQVVGVCRGRSEVGPRALCHRSLLASPTTAAIRDRVNAIKRREPWRPFGPVSRADAGHGLWQPIGHLERYMIGAAQVTGVGEQHMPATIHVDRTTRPQRLGPGEPFIEAVLAGLACAGHPPVLLNTSFNGPGEPMVETATQAVSCARRLGVPACVVDDALVIIPPRPWSNS